MRVGFSFAMPLGCSAVFIRVSPHTNSPSIVVCRRCGTVACELCTSNKQPLPIYGYATSVRVCRDCHGQTGPVPTAAQRAERAAHHDAEEERKQIARREAQSRDVATKRAMESEDRKARIRADIASKSAPKGR